MGYSFAAGREQGARRIPDLFDNARVTAANHRRLHFGSDCEKAVVQNLERDLVECHQLALTSKRCPLSCTRTVHVGGITVVVSACSIMSGPSADHSEGRSIRS